MGTAWDNNVNNDGKNEVKGIEADGKKDEGRKGGKKKGRERGE